MRAIQEHAAHTPQAPWGSHTVPILGDPDIYVCNFNPARPQNNGEFGSVYTDTQWTIAAARAIYGELSAHSLSREGMYVPLSLTTTLTVNGVQTTLDEAIVLSVTDWGYDAPQQRRDYEDDLVQALRAQPRARVTHMPLPYMVYDVIHNPNNAVDGVGHDHEFVPVQCHMRTRGTVRPNELARSALTLPPTSSLS